jgi:predicted RNA binding protein YcfA (HicA-like mRNA interferase family)
MTKTLSYQGLESALRAFGYESRKKADHVVLEHPDGRLMIVLPRVDPRSDVSPLHWKIVEKTIRDDAIVEWDDLEFYLEHDKRREDFIKRGDRLLMKTPGNGREIKVSAAADEQDGMVIIEQKGIFSPCPADRLRKEASVPSK